ncbi:MAG: protein phosphatase 2C domain-containing protein [Myxococcota bacterium]
MRIRQAVAGTHPGAIRTFNEDAVLRLGRVPLYAISDGMGGAGAGDVAAQLALDVIKRHAMAVRDQNTLLADERSPEHRRALQRHFDTLFNKASRAIREEAARRNQPVMGASLVLVTVVNDYAYVGHVGDARAYLLRNGSLQRLTEDHTLAELKLRRGKITLKDYESHPERHVLYQSLGAPFDLDVDLAEVRLEDGDVIMLCSDGVVGALDDATIKADLNAVDLNSSLRGLLRTCIEARCSDNVSAVLLGMEGEARTEVTAREDIATTPGVSPEDDTAGGEPLPTAPVAPPTLDVRGTLFASLSDEERTLIAPFLTEAHVPAGQRVVSVGDPADRVAVLVAGRVLLTSGGVPLGERADGVVGRLAFGHDALQVVQAVAMEPATVLWLVRPQFDALRQQHPDVAARLAMALTDAATGDNAALVDRLGAVDQALRGRR